jgi:hypothetical protein
MVGGAPVKDARGSQYGGQGDKLVPPASARSSFFLSRVKVTTRTVLFVAAVALAALSLFLTLHAAGTLSGTPYDAEATASAASAASLAVGPGG